MFSTFHVFNHMLKAQVDDLVGLGCNPSIKVFTRKVHGGYFSFLFDASLGFKHVVFELWARYLQKLKVAFNEDDIEYVNDSNVKWHRYGRARQMYALKHI
jgi:hypothetical protein